MLPGDALLPNATDSYSATASATVTAVAVTFTDTGADTATATDSARDRGDIQKASYFRTHTSRGAPGIAGHGLELTTFQQKAGALTARPIRQLHYKKIDIITKMNINIKWLGISGLSCALLGLPGLGLAGLGLAGLGLAGQGLAGLG